MWRRPEVVTEGGRRKDASEGAGADAGGGVFGVQPEAETREMGAVVKP